MNILLHLQQVPGLSAATQNLVRKALVSIILPLQRYIVHNVSSERFGAMDSRWR